MLFLFGPQEIKVFLHLALTARKLSGFVSQTSVKVLGDLLGRVSFPASKNFFFIEFFFLQDLFGFVEKVVVLFVKLFFFNVLSHRNFYFLFLLSFFNRK
jgi:hypothetical protein